MVAGFNIVENSNEEWNNPISRTLKIYFKLVLLHILWYQFLVNPIYW